MQQITALLMKSLVQRIWFQVRSEISVTIEKHLKIIIANLISLFSKIGMAILN